MGYFENSVQEAESAFYSAFEHLDVDLMKATWLNSDEAFCIHPGGPAHSGYETVVRHWSYVLGGSVPTPVSYRIIQAIEKENFATHLVQEMVGPEGDQVVILATNNYVRSSEGWRMLSHHASLPPMASADRPQDSAVH